MNIVSHKELQRKKNRFHILILQKQFHKDLGQNFQHVLVKLHSNILLAVIFKCLLNKLC